VTRNDPREALQVSHLSEVLRSESAPRQLRGSVAKTSLDGGVRNVAQPRTLRRLEFESFTDNGDGLRERTGTEAESSFDDARLAAVVVREVEGRRLAFA
jgi:hypothetical protein